MKYHYLTHRMADYYPMTPPDEPPEPDMSQVDACTKCGKDDWIGFIRLDDLPPNYGDWAVKCFRCNRTGPTGCDCDAAAETWNKWQKE